ncbi:MAG: HIT domain-containing protein [Kiritimatiellae bacterium]|nr:HIT domain-containing protein [Kiritimatiellia bacterium]MDD4735170.1 HIT domain-containing protein [Kiritimatiellia bacterium]
MTKQLWAPWRMDYIRNNTSAGCFMCEAFSRDEDRKNLIARRGETCAVILNRYPYTNGHLMVAPYRHLPDLESMSREERTEMLNLAAWCTSCLSRMMHPHGFNIGINLGEVAGAGLKDHVHLHVVPRWSGDTNFMPVFGETRVIPQALEEVWDQLREQPTD